MKIEIEWTHDSNDCETCGSSWSEGATVKIDGEEVLKFEPIAHCYNFISYEKEMVYFSILEHLGHELVETEPQYVSIDYEDDDEDDDEDDGSN